jgi:hypothetical protein
MFVVVINENEIVIIDGVIVIKVIIDDGSNDYLMIINCWNWNGVIIDERIAYN